MRTTLLSFIDDFARRKREKVFSHKPELRVVEWSGEQVAESIYQFARELDARRIAKGDRVLLWAKNRPEWVVAFFGCLLRGVVVVPLDLHSSLDFVERVKAQTTPKLLIYSDEYGIALDQTLDRIKLEDLAQIIKQHSTAPYSQADINEDDLVEIIYTSGTTADPKGVCLTHKNLLANILPLERGMQKYLRFEWLIHPMRFLSLVPLSHVFGQFMGLFVPQLLTGEVHFQESLNPSEIITTVKRERISVIVTIPRLLESLRDKIEREWQASGEAEKFHQRFKAVEGKHFLRKWLAFKDIHRRLGWKFWAFVSGGATLDAETEEFWHRLGYLTVQGYGMTETASLVSFNNPFEATRGSIGKTFASQEIKIDESGEILVRGTNVSPGYWQNGVKPFAGAEGWLRTGDIAERDAEGKLFFKGRKKDVIVTAAGLNIYAEDLEAALNHQPEVRDSAVIAIEGARGAEPLAVLLLHDEHADAQTIIKRANQSLSEYQQIRRWFVWQDADFPRTTTTQKTRKRDIVEVVRSELAGSKVHQPSASPLLETIARLSGEAVSQLNASANIATDLKLDSIGRVELLSALEERYQVELDESAFTAATTLGDIEKMIHQTGTSGEINPPVEVKRPYPFAEWAYRFPATWIRLVALYLLILPAVRLLGSPSVRGKAHLKNLRAPVLLVSNHITQNDAGLILAALPFRFRRKLAIAMLGERLRDMRYPPKGVNWFRAVIWKIEWLLITGFFNVFPLPQEGGFRKSFAFAGQAVDRGYNVLVFPEGTRAKDGLLHPFMRGTGLLVEGLNIPVVPVKIDGLFELKQKGKHFALPGQIKITFGESVSYANRDADFITRDLQQRVANLS
ncbi:MAG: AMP-binding protein [Acidobacteriota bacterium]